MACTKVGWSSVVLAQLWWDSTTEVENAWKFTAASGCVVGEEIPLAFLLCHLRGFWTLSRETKSEEKLLISDGLTERGGK